MPFKANPERRHQIPKQRHRATNSAACDAALRLRGSFVVWFSDAAIATWKAEPRRTRGIGPRDGLQLTKPLAEVGVRCVSVGGALASVASDEMLRVDDVLRGRELPAPLPGQQTTASMTTITSLIRVEICLRPGLAAGLTPSHQAVSRTRVNYFVSRDAR